MVEQFHLKVLHAVLAVRTPRPLAAAAAPAAASAFRRRDRWFHLPLHDPPPPPEAADRLEPLAPGEPLVVDVLLSPAGGGAGPGGEVVERWTVACEPWPDAAGGEEVAVNRAYKHCFTLLRSVYAVLRVLPAYRVFRLLCANHSYNYEMVHRVDTFAEPFSRATRPPCAPTASSPSRPSSAASSSPSSTSPALPPSTSRSPPFLPPT